MNLKNILCGLFLFAWLMGPLPSPVRASEYHGPNAPGIAIDIGHSKAKFGAVSARGVGEYWFNEQFARLLLAELHARGLKNAFIVETRGRDVDLIERAKIANQRKPALLLSIHHDSVQPHYLSAWEYQGQERQYSDHFEGFSLFVSYKRPDPHQSLALARLIGAELISHGFSPTMHHAENIPGESRELLDEPLGIYRFDDLIILKYSASPAVLFECGILVNRKEEAMLTNPKRRGKMVQCLADAIDSYLGTLVPNGQDDLIYDLKKCIW